MSHPGETLMVEMKAIPHGTQSGYSYHKCRCDECREVKHAADRAYYERNQERVRAKTAAYRAANPAKRNEGQRAYREANKETLKAKKAAYYRKHKEEAANRVKAWREANPEKHKANTARYRDKHRDKRRADSLARYYRQMAEEPAKVRARRREWKRTERGRAYQRLANHRRRQAPMGPEVLDWWMSLEDPICAYCDNPATEIDHDIPVSRGGSSELSNLVPACRSCNASKNNRTAQEFLAAKGA